MHITGMGAFSPPAETPAPPKRDGRTLRSERSRARMVEAARVLMRGGFLRPTAEMIRQTADVSVRSVFQRFDTMDALYAAALEDEALAVQIAAPARLLSNQDLARAIVLGSVPSGQ